MQEAESQREAQSGDAPWRAALDELERTLDSASRAIGELRQALEGEHHAGPVLTLLGRSDQEGEPAPPPPEEASRLSNFERVWERLQRSRGQDEPKASVEAEPEAALGTEAIEAPVHEEDEAGAPARSEAETGAEMERSSSPPDAGSQIGDFERVWERLQREREEGQTDTSASGAPAPRVLENLPQEYRMTIEDRDGAVDLVPVHRALRAFARADDITLASYANGTPVVAIRTVGELDLERLGAAIGAATSRECEVIEQGNGKLFLRLTDAESTEG